MATESRVLVVDDEHALRRLLRLYLENEGYTVLEADNGLDGLSLLRRGGIDVALVDVMLPGLDGFELVRRIRAESNVPIILLTARGEETHRVAGLEIGADDYVVKPFSAPEVVARVLGLSAVEIGRLHDEGLAALLGELTHEARLRRRGDFFCRPRGHAFFQRSFFGCAYHATRRTRPRRKSAMISRAALWPGAPVTPPPGCVPAPHM